MGKARNFSSLCKIRERQRQRQTDRQRETDRELQDSEVCVLCGGGGRGGEIPSRV